MVPAEQGRATLKIPVIHGFPWRWALAWLIVPLLPVILTWPVGGPPMGRYVMGFGLFALAASLLPWLMLRRALLVLLPLAVATVYVGAVFNITLYNYELLLPFLREVRPLRSPEYVVGGLVVAAAMALGWWLAPRVPRLGNVRHLALALLGVFALTNLDNLATARTAGSYVGLPKPGAPFDSAVRASGVEQPGAGRRNLVVVLVEALGEPVEPGEKALFEADWNRPEWRSRYDVTRGLVPYHGSTTSGELRELCGIWGDYHSAPFDRIDCLPERYARAGYRTEALHGFDGGFFDRTQWWPKLGFADTSFGNELRGQGVAQCGGVFPGACDGAVAQLLGQRLRGAKQPQLLYWVTLNSHLPVLADPALGTDDCQFGGKVLADGPPMLCRLFLVHHRLADALTALAMDPSLPPTDFLIVGDHMPPFFQRDARLRFDGEHVPWVLLRSRS